MKNICTHSHLYAAIISLSFLILCSSNIVAQCNTFHNADSANPILKASPAPQNINGLKFVDIDGDGDKDCYVVSGTSMLLYRNVGTPTHPQFVLCPNNGFENSSLTYFTNVFAFTDLDGDGDLDFVTPGFTPYQDHGGGAVYIDSYENIGSAQNPVFVKGGANPAAVADNNPFNGYVDISFQDIDGDGKLDLYVAEQAFSGLLENFYLNTSTTAAPSYTFYSTYASPFSYPYISFYDFTGDGLPDLIQNNGVNYSSFSPNFGAVGAPQYQFFYYGPGPDFAGIAPYTLVDLNGDGAVEEFNINGHYGIVAPVAVINKTDRKIGDRMFTKLTASGQSDAYTYSWEYNGKMISGYHKPFIYALKKGGYVLYIKDTCGTGVSLPYYTADSSLIASSAAMSVNDFMINDNLTPAVAAAKAYPNPFSSQFIVQIPAAGKAMQNTIKITDLAGRTVLSQTTSAATITTGRALQKGTYLLQVWQGNKLVYHTMMMKQ